jgi:putative oxidoreductase
MYNDTLATVWAPRFLSLLRIISAALMMQHGAQKLFGVLGKEAQPLFSFMGFAGVLEFGVAGLLLIGLFSRTAAFLLSGTMAVAYFQAHAPQGFWPVLNKGELAVLYCWVYFYLFAAGPGPLSVDAMLAKKA